MADPSMRPNNAGAPDPVVGYPPPMIVRPSPRPEGPELDVRRLWFALLESKWLIVGTTIGVALLFLIVTMFSRMHFHVEGSLYLGDAQAGKSVGAGRGEMFDFLGGLGQSEVATELEILRSRSLIEQAILES